MAFLFIRWPSILLSQVSRDYYETRPEDDTIPIRDLKGNTDCKTQSR